MYFASIKIAHAENVSAWNNSELPGKSRQILGPTVMPSRPHRPDWYFFSRTSNVNGTVCTDVLLLRTYSLTHTLPRSQTNRQHIKAKP